MASINNNTDFEILMSSVNGLVQKYLDSKVMDVVTECSAMCDVSVEDIVKNVPSVNAHFGDRFNAVDHAAVYSLSRVERTMAEISIQNEETPPPEAPVAAKKRAPAAKKKAPVVVEEPLEAPVVVKKRAPAAKKKAAVVEDEPVKNKGTRKSQTAGKKAVSEVQVSDLPADEASWLMDDDEEDISEVGTARPSLNMTRAYYPTPSNVCEDDEIIDDTESDPEDFILDE